MNPLENAPPDIQDPTADGWIGLAPVHFFLWIVLFASLLHDLLWVVLPFRWHAWMFVGWGFTLLHWALGGLALGVAFQARAGVAPGSARRAAFALAAALLGAKIGLRLVREFAPRGTMNTQPFWMISQGIFVLMGLGVLILLFVRRGEEPGGRYDAAVAAVAFGGGLEWIGLPVLAIAAMRKHPLLAAQWQALRAPKAALEGGWFDAQDEGLRLRNLGACALLLAAAPPLLTGYLVHLFMSGVMRLGETTFWWALADIIAAYLGSLFLALHVNRRARGQKGRGPAVIALLINALPLLLLLAAVVFLALVLTDTIHFRLF